METPWQEIGYIDPSAAERGVAAPGGSSGAPPSNRAPDTCIPDESFQVLWQGIDSLELSFSGSTNPDIEATLRELKERAKSRDPGERAAAQYAALDQVFRVSDKGWGFYSFVLDNDCFRISLASRGASRVPMASCQIRSEYLAHKGAAAAVAELRVVVTELGLLDGAETVSRLDPAVDFVTDLGMSDWDQSGWITRAKLRRGYWEPDLFTGWSVGLGSPTAFRLYLKSHEIDTQSHKVYLHELWRAADWPPGYPVWRAEGQLRRQALEGLRIRTVADVLKHLPGIWGYLTGQWLRFALVSGGDSTRSRWPTHPVWCSLAAVRWDGDTAKLTRQYKAAGLPTDEYLGRVGLSVLSATMARDGILDPAQGLGRLYELIKQSCGRQAEFLQVGREEVLLDKVREKGRRYHTMNNIVAPTLTPTEEYFAAEAYRRQSDGW